MEDWDLVEEFNRIRDPEGIEWGRALRFLLSFPLSHNYIYLPFVGLPLGLKVFGTMSASYRRGGNAFFFSFFLLIPYSRAGLFP